MPPLSELGKFKRLAELFVLAMKVNLTITHEQHQMAIYCLTEYGLSEHQAESFLNSGFEKLERGLIRNPELVMQAVADAFRPRDHGYILSQIQAILETQPITEEVQKFFDRCCEYLYHEM
ncbi:MAG: hypothetical protein D6820_13805 [Lentisphaerae bacterium]|nr:MAG: hypothetical protein D6820_13805 [Lentisphaerota bacterium]